MSYRTGGVPRCLGTPRPPLSGPFSATCLCQSAKTAADLSVSNPFGGALEFLASTSPLPSTLTPPLLTCRPPPNDPLSWPY